MSKPIEDYGLIGDMRTAALVAKDGSIDWACFPRFDSPAAMAALLGDQSNGFWSLRANGGVATRAYVPDTLVLATLWQTPGGVARVYDFMPPASIARSPSICRVVEGVSGEVHLTSVLSVRLDYGRTVPWVRRFNGVSTQLTAGPDSLWLSGPVRARGVHRQSITEFTVRAGERASLCLAWQPSHVPCAPAVDPPRWLAETLRFWTSWSAGCTYAGTHRDAVVRSLITLKALTYAETGGIVAAPTTSLPEMLGGGRNWDYRYCWLRDASLTLKALLDNGLLEEAYGWREWLVRAVAGCPSQLQIAYGVDGSRRIPEYEIHHLSGYEASRPVRAGNAAAEQFQLDVYGEVISAIELARRKGMRQPVGLASLQRYLLDHLAVAWHHPDEGIWEIRTERRHHVYSKIMAWSAFDQAGRAAAAGMMRGPVSRWASNAAAIRAEIDAHGWSEEKRSFTVAYGTENLDASLLLIGQTGFLAPDDPRIVSTVEAVERELVTDGLVVRYRTSAASDGIPGGEGAFLACSFWLVDALAGIGRVNDAEDLFDHLLGLRNDLGLLAEEYDIDAKRQVGNFPQAFSHIQLAVSARALGAGDANASPVMEQAGTVLPTGTFASQQASLFDELAAAR